MNRNKLLMIASILIITTVNASAQINPYINVLPANSGVVPVGGTLDLQITIGNTGTLNVPANKLRPVITVPNAIVTLLPDAQQTGLPPGWSIVTNDGTQIRICNGTDAIGAGVNRTIIIKIQGNNIGGPSGFSGQIFFGSASTCANSGPAVTGNNTADDNSSSNITVIAAPLPLTLLNFTATSKNCEPMLNWITENEINTDRFEIERSTASNSAWRVVGTNPATGNNNSTANNYSFTDNTAASSEKIFYRLKMIDKDGMFKYSEILAVNIDCKTTSVSVYPNPIKNGKLYVSVAGIKAKTQAYLLSTSGQFILQTKINNGTNFINVSTLANGIYILNMVEENVITKRVKVIIQN